MKKILSLLILVLCVLHSRSQSLRELSGTYIISERYQDTILVFMYNDTTVLLNKMKKDFSKYASDSVKFSGVFVLYRMMDDNYRATKLTLSEDSTFKFISARDTINGKLEILAGENKIQLYPYTKPSRYFDRNTLNLKYTIEGERIKISSISRSPIIYRKINE